MQKVAIVCHDAGGAEVVSNWIAEAEGFEFFYLLAGPAIQIFKKNLPAHNCCSHDTLLRECDWLLCGTSWQSSIELKAIVAFRSEKKKAIAFLDHWANYEERFKLDKDLILPDELWVGDDYALQIAKDTFIYTPVINVENAYFSKIKNQLVELELLNPRKNSSVLYVCEPLREHALLQHGNERYWGYTEEDALEYFLENRLSVCNAIDKIVIRPHPSEKPYKYDWALEKYGSDIDLEIGGKLTISEEITNSYLVVGCESMAMVIGILANKEVVSSIPPGGKSCSLPHNEIKRLRDIIEYSDMSDA